MSKASAEVSATRHTPGPWALAAKLSASENHKGYEIWAQGKWLADISPQCDKEGDASDEGRATACLIASAPELLEALRATVNFIGGARSILDKANAALAKAEGRSQ